jgi:RNA polymerase sigma factor (sigma-70 family)
MRDILEENMENYIDKIIIWECLNQLDKQDQQIILLYYWWGYRDTEIGEILGLSQQVINYRRNRALKQIKQYIFKGNPSP